MNFKDWIVQYRKRDSRRGDFAYDVYKDQRFPKSNDRAVISHYLRKIRRVDRDVHEVFAAAWRAYLSWRRQSIELALLKRIDELEKRVKELEKEERRERIIESLK